MGIEPQFRNAKGETIRTSSDTKRNLLAAMGIEATDELQIRAVLDQLDRAEWLRPLPVIKVVHLDSQPLSIELILPADTREITWCLTLEDGAERSGHTAFKQLELVDGRNFEETVLERRPTTRSIIRVGKPCSISDLALAIGATDYG